MRKIMKEGIQLINICPGDDYLRKRGQLFMHHIDFKVFEPAHTVSPDLYGIFIEDINFACDGGLNANMVNNYSFDGVYYDNQTQHPIFDYLRYWSVQGGMMISGQQFPIHPNSRYAQVNVDGKCLLSNLGYNGGKLNKGKCAMAIRKTEHNQFECFIRSKDFAGKITVYVCDENGKTITEQKAIRCSQTWTLQQADLIGKANEYGKLVIELNGTGTVDLDCVSLMNANYWNCSDTKWQHGKLRKDLVDALAELKPRFIRFPGGCIVEGKKAGNEYNWKNTIGSLYERKSDYSLWSEKMEDGGYNQSFQIGFYEYFCLCEDLGAKPLPTLYAGMNCQLRTKDKLDIDSTEFDSYVVQNYLDLIEFAGGDPDQSKWAALRKDMGHPKPFELSMIGIGNENYGKDYLHKFEYIKKAIHEHYPQITCVLSSGFLPFKMFMRPAWNLARKKYPTVIVDEHSYHSPKWFQKQVKRFDRYKRGTAKVYFGEYAANGLMAGIKQTSQNANTFESALAEAAFLTGVERNSDVVVMTSYAPLFNLVGSEQWNHNLIDFNPAGYCRTANYLVQQLFADNVGKEVISHGGKLPPKLFVSATADSEKLYIKIVNCSKTAQAFHLGVNGIDDQVIPVRYIACDDMKGKNTLAFTGEVKEPLEIIEESITVNSEYLDINVRAYSVTVVAINVQSD